MKALIVAIVLGGVVWGVRQALLERACPEIPARAAIGRLRR